MSTLPDRLADLADRPGAAAPPATAHELWRRGRSRHRRLRAGTAAASAVAVAVLVVLAVTSVPALQRTPDAPAGTRGGGLPDRLFQPSPWLAGTADAGPLGPLSVVSYAERRSLTGTTQGAPFGVSARTGAYRFLDLPDRAAHSASALSPDGRHLAYWTAGAGTKTSQRVDDGVAVYDTSTGGVRTFPIPTGYGLAQEGLVWAGDSTLVIQYAQALRVFTERTGERSGPREPMLVWSLGAAAPARRPALDRLGGVLGSFRDVVVVWPGSRLALADATSGRVERRFGRVSQIVGQPAPSPDLHQLAFVTNGGTPVTVMTPDGRRVVPGPVRSSSVLGWRDDTHVVVDAIGRPTAVEHSLVDVDVDTGAATILTRLGPDSSSVLVAGDLLARPTVHASRPPAPLDRRVAAGLGVVVGLGLVALLVGWRRRVRP